MKRLYKIVKVVKQTTENKEHVGILDTASCILINTRIYVINRVHSVEYKFNLEAQK